MLWVRTSRHTRRERIERMTLVRRGRLRRLKKMTLKSFVLSSIDMPSPTADTASSVQGDFTHGLEQKHFSFNSTEIISPVSPVEPLKA
jgi:hypothetical protein